MICSVEAILNEKEISLKDAIQLAKRDFEPLGFVGIMEERQREWRKKFSKAHWNWIKEFFKFPQIVFSIVLFISFYFVLENFNNSLKTAYSINLILVPFLIIEFIKLYRLRKKQGQLLLRTETFLSNNIMLALVLPQMSLNILNGFKESLDMNNILLKIVISIVLVYSFLSIVVFRKMAISEIKEVKKLYFSYL